MVRCSGKVLFLLLPVAASYGAGVPSLDAANAAKAYQDLLHRFWFGTAQDGHFGDITNDRDVIAPVHEIPVEKGWMWQYAEAWNPIYVYWRTTHSSDAKVRLIAEWRWVTKNWSLADMHRCGRVGRQSATTQDDSSWMAMGLVQLYEATGDREALAFSKAVIDCAMERWGDDATGGGLWYDDEHQANTGKSVTNGNFALAMLYLYEHTCAIGKCDRELLHEVESIENWAARRLLRDDGLYWMSFPNPRRPDQIEPTSSVVALFGNMGFAALDARLYGISKDPVYRERARRTTAGILRYEVRDGAFLDDRDARGNGYAAWNFAHEAVPILDRPQPVIDAFLTTGRNVVAHDRSPEGAYGGDWSGPLEGIWASKGFHHDRMEISGNAVIWPIAALEFVKE